MYVYYKDKNDTIGFVELTPGVPHRFEVPVFVFHIELKNQGKENDYFFGLLGLNPYELACVSRNLNCCFEPQEHMFTFKTIEAYIYLKEKRNTEGNTSII